VEVVDGERIGSAEQVRQLGDGSVIRLGKFGILAIRLLGRRRELRSVTDYEGD